MIEIFKRMVEIDLFFYKAAAKEKREIFSTKQPTLCKFT